MCWEMARKESGTSSGSRDPLIAVDCLGLLWLDAYFVSGSSPDFECGSRIRRNALLGKSGRLGSQYAIY
jgi:hypothetical protein